MQFHELPEGFLGHKDITGMMRVLVALALTARKASGGRVPVADIADEAKISISTADGYLRRLSNRARRGPSWNIIATDDGRTYWWPEMVATPAKRHAPTEALDVATRLDQAWYPNSAEPHSRVDLEFREELTDAIRRGHPASDLFAMLQPRARDVEKIENPIALLRTKLKRLRAMDEDDPTGPGTVN